MSEDLDVLVVDDDREVRDALRHVLERRGFSVRLANDASGALDEYRRQPPDLVITDIVMPGVDGVALIRALRREFPAARILAVSGGGKVAEYYPDGIATGALLKAAEGAGADLTITKPFERHELFDAIARLLTAH